MPLPTVSEARALAAATRINRWDISFIGSVAGVTAPADVSLRAESVTLPTPTYEGDVEINVRGIKTFEAGDTTRGGEMTFTTTERIDGAMFEFIKGCREAMRAPDTGLRTVAKVDQLFTLTIQLLGLDGVPWYQYDLQGCFFKSAEPGGEPDGATQDPFKPIMTFGYDDFKEKKL